MVTGRAVEREIVRRLILDSCNRLTIGKDTAPCVSKENEQAASVDVRAFINDKHIEVIARQMMRWVKIEDVGDTEFLIDEQVDKFRFLEENERVISEGGRPATAQPLLLGITKASLSTDSFISAASFQE